ncbi:sensor histidine kinase [Psychrobacillus vulpis]|uniref:histidine kinase n=1 Tax=Psychrobacillus vulpis TaxID=2325572 RepID=A0A544TQ88_9BACI|nr:HAMP domain-containing sensor histidine kinase [Psychrobacillus vulpis]TQR19623.1 GHKL domain-containing protein [Psychrobacillus vulpis]
MLETLLINILFLIFPVLLIVVFFDRYIKEYHYIFFLLFFSLSMILCMIYPFKLEIGFIFDLRYVPFIIVALYGGHKRVFPLYIILNVHRFIIGGEGLFQSFLFSTVIFITVPMLTQKFSGYNTRKRIMTGVIAVLLTVVFYLLSLSTFFEELTKQYWTLAFYAVIAHTIVIALNMIMIERIISNIKNRENFLRAERLHVMSELSASVSHEIRNPLTVTKGFLQLLSVSRTIKDEDKAYIEYSLQELIRAENILNDYLAFAKPQSENMVHSDLKEEMEYVKNVLMPFAVFNNVEIDYQFTNSLKKDYDQNQMKQCLINIMKNSIEAMKDDGGTLSIKVMEQGKNIIISIQDNGVGMTNDEIRQLGKPYYSTKKEGTGLGMLMVYGTISKIKGKIDVQSRTGEGTTFTITIPT